MDKQEFESGISRFLINLEDDTVLLRPAVKSDFQEVYQAASDPDVWSQHDAHNRWQEDVFKDFFEGGLANDLGMYVIFRKDTGGVIGSTRFYKYDALTNTVRIGYTFFEKSCWGKGYNDRVKQLMLDHAFQYVNLVCFEIYEKNFRSQKAVEKLGATRMSSKSGKLVYQLKKEVWAKTE